MNYEVDKLISVMRYIDAEAQKLLARRVTYDQEAIKRGLQISKTVCTQPEEVVATPIMKSLMIALGDIKETEKPDGTITHTRLATGTKSRAVEWMNRVVDKALRKYNGAEQHDYPDDIPVDSKRLYDIDCWNGWKKEIWDIQPGQEQQLKDGFKTYTNPHTNASVQEVIQYLRSSTAMQASVPYLLRELPLTTASREIREISDPFMSKGTGVSYPDYRNDRALESPGKTYAQYEIDLTAKANEGGLNNLIRFGMDNNVYTGYARWQRGSGRPLIAQSRRTNLVINTVNAPELAKWKEAPALNAAFVNEEQLGNHLFYLGDWVLNHEDSDAANIDYSKWDRNLGIGWICFENAARYMRATDERTRRLIIMRYAVTKKGLLVNGLAGKAQFIFGRQMSGIDDTTLGNTTANRGMSRGTLATLDPNHVRNYTIPLSGKDITCVGDDLLAIAKKGFISRFARTSNDNTHTVVHEDEKHARGIMFIQYRAFRLDGKWVMAYNWPRVLRSMLSKETLKQLGMGGWTLAFYQQLGKLIQVPEALTIVCNITAAIDPYHLNLDTPVSVLMKMVVKEDQERVKAGTTNRKVKLSRKATTAERLYNANPNIPGVKTNGDGSVELDEGYFADIQNALRKVYDPEFLPRQLGIPNPKVRVAPSA